MTQQYTPVAWQDETTSQQGTLINAERLNQMQTAHHFADGLEEVDAIPTADPGVEYHKIVYCTADSTIYRWDGTEWTADIDDETKRLLQEEIARATQAESTLRGQLEDEHDARVGAEAAINDRITDEAAELAQRIATETSTRYTADTALGTRITNETSARETADTGLGNRITAEATARADADTALGGRIDTEQARATAAEQANAQAIANTYTKAEIDTALGAKADVATTYTKTEADALLALKADQATTYTKAETDTLLGAKANNNAVVHLAGAETIPGAKTFTEVVSFNRTIGLIRHDFSGIEYGVTAGAWNSEIYRDKNNVEIGRQTLVVDANKTSWKLRAKNGDSTMEMGLDSNASGPYVYAPTPGAGAPETAVPTINWVSQTGAGRLNNIIHDIGNENFSGSKNGTVAYTIASILSGSLDPNQDYYKWFKVAKIQPGRYARLTYNISFPYNNSRYMIMDAVIITARTQNINTSSLVKISQVANIIDPSLKYLAIAYDGTDINIYIKSGQFTHQTLYATAATSGGDMINASDIITPLTPTLEDPTTQQFYLEI